jgi:hypothetical protein
LRVYLRFVCAFICALFAGLFALYLRVYLRVYLRFIFAWCLFGANKNSSQAELRKPPAIRASGGAVDKKRCRDAFLGDNEKAQHPGRKRLKTP